MAAPRELKRRITSVRSTKQITKAMELVSSAKMRKASERALADRPYEQKLASLIGKALGASGEVSHPLTTPAKGDKVLLIVISADRGLAGAYNTAILRAAQGFIRHQGKEVVCVTIGTKIFGSLTISGIKVLQNYPLPSAGSDPEELQALASFAIQQFLEEDIAEAYVLYTHFHSMLRQEPTLVQLLPIRGLKPSGKPATLFEPAAPQLLGALLPHYLHIQLFKAVLESAASEHSARRMAMKSATDNASSMIDRLTLRYNGLRQSAITQELAEITGGAAAI